MTTESKHFWDVLPEDLSRSLRRLNHVFYRVEPTILKCYFSTVRYYRRYDGGIFHRHNYCVLTNECGVLSWFLFLIDLLELSVEKYLKCPERFDSFIKEWKRGGTDTVKEEKIESHDI